MPTRQDQPFTQNQKVYQTTTRPGAKAPAKGDKSQKTTKPHSDRPDPIPAPVLLISAPFGTSVSRTLQLGLGQNRSCRRRDTLHSRQNHPSTQKPKDLPVRKNIRFTRTLALLRLLLNGSCERQDKLHSRQNHPSTQEPKDPPARKNIRFIRKGPRPTATRKAARVLLTRNSSGKRRDHQLSRQNHPSTRKPKDPPARKNLHFFRKGQQPVATRQTARAPSQ